MPVCSLCALSFPNWIIIDGVRKNLSSRKYCLDCSPFGRGNRRRLQVKLGTGKKECKECKAVFPVEEFPVRDRKYRYATCAACTLKRFRDYSKNRHRERKEKAVQLSGGSCQVCNRSGPLCIFDFHHKTQKDATISRLWGRRWEAIESELRKCLLLCVNCHREIHYEPKALTATAQSYRLKQQALVGYKGGACQVCGYRACVAALDFHHIDGTTKRFKIADRITSSLETLKAEVDKCVLLCAVCHRLEHAKSVPRESNPEPTG